MKPLPLCLALACLALAGYAPSAGAAPTARQSSSSFCGVARGVAKDIVSSTTMAKRRVNPTDIMITYKKVHAAEPALLAAAPSPVKSRLRPVFGFVNLVIADYKKVNWDPSALGPFLPSLAARGVKIEPQLQALRTYFRTTCKIDV
jgi:hypothetical protein